MIYDVLEVVGIREIDDPDQDLNQGCFAIIANLLREFTNYIKYAMECGKKVKIRYDNEGLSGFYPKLNYIREGEWV